VAGGRCAKVAGDGSGGAFAQRRHPPPATPSVTRHLLAPPVPPHSSPITASFPRHLSSPSAAPPTLPTHHPQPIPSPATLAHCLSPPPVTRHRHPPPSRTARTPHPSPTTSTITLTAPRTRHGSLDPSQDPAFPPRHVTTSTNLAAPCLPTAHITTNSALASTLPAPVMTITTLHKNHTLHNYLDPFQTSPATISGILDPWGCTPGPAKGRMQY
jgi:hypothetical protein